MKASFFFTGRFYRNPSYRQIVRKLKDDKHYMGAHSDQHLLYCDWIKRDSLLVTKNMFKNDLDENYKVMLRFGITKKEAEFFLPPYEWYNDSIATWTMESGLQLINYSPGTRTNADYTYPELGKSFKTNSEIYQSITDFEKQSPKGLNGFILLMHIGTDPRRKEKFYLRLPALIKVLKNSQYSFVKINELLN